MYMNITGGGGGGGGVNYHCVDITGQHNVTQYQCLHSQMSEEYHQNDDIFVFLTD